MSLFLDDRPKLSYWLLSVGDISSLIAPNGSIERCDLSICRREESASKCEVQMVMRSLFSLRRRFLERITWLKTTPHRYLIFLGNQTRLPNLWLKYPYGTSHSINPCGLNVIYFIKHLTDKFNCKRMYRINQNVSFSNILYAYAWHMQKLQCYCSFLLEKSYLSV